MSRLLQRVLCFALLSLAVATGAAAAPAEDAALPAGVRAAWDLDKAYRETTPTRERISINGLWRWQPASANAAAPPRGNYGFFKVPGSWPGITDYMMHDCQTVFRHPSWRNVELGEVTAAWYERTIAIPKEWSGRRITLTADTINSFAAVYIDGKRAGQMQFPAGEVDLTAVCRPGATHVLSLYVMALPLKAVMTSFSDTASSHETRGQVERRGLCGDVWLAAGPAGPTIDTVKIDTSYRKSMIRFNVAMRNLKPEGQYALRAEISDQGKPVAAFSSQPFTGKEVGGGRFAFLEKWRPEKLWDIHTPRNQYQVQVSLIEDGKPLDVSLPSTFGFREFWIDGRDFYLNGTRIYLSALPLDNAQVGAAWADYAGACESLRRLKGIGINFVYTHNYGCEPGTHLGFAEILRACDDVGMLVSFSQPHFGQYEWQAADADANNGYARHAAHYVAAAGNHPAVVMYSMSHNATGYAEDMNPDLIDGLPENDPRDSWSINNVRQALRAEAIVHRLDPMRIVYHHSSGNLSSMHNMNFYTNMAPAQELDDWFEHWAAKGVKPVFTCEYMVPCTWDWTMYRGWYKGSREFGSAVVPWEFCVAEWSSQFLGDRVYDLGEPEKKNIRWEAEQFRQGRLWHRWDYPHQVGSPVFDSQHEIIGQYLTTNWRSFRTWGVSAISPWEHHFFWRLRPGVEKRRRDMKVDWDHLQRPGFSADYVDAQYERMDMAFELKDWEPTADGRAILRNNQPLLAYIAGKPDAFTSKDHTFYRGETVEKQLIVINNSRETVACDCRWSFDAADGPLSGKKQLTVATGQQERVPIRVTIPDNCPFNRHKLSASVKFSTGEVQDDAIDLTVLIQPSPMQGEKFAIWDPKGETTALLAKLGLKCQKVDARADLSKFDVLIVGKGALTVDGPAPDLARVRDGLAVLVFEQSPEALEQRLGFRIAEYGLRQVFPVGDNCYSLDSEDLRDWRGAATLLPPRLKYELSPRYNYTPVVPWCNLEAPRVWRCGNRGNVASALIEKPAQGDFFPMLQGGYSLQYSPLLRYREGKGRMVFCQMDVSGRTEDDPAALNLTRGLLEGIVGGDFHWAPPDRRALYAGNAAGLRHLTSAGIPITAYDGGKLAADDVLVVGSGGGERLAANRPAIADFLKAGGHLLLLGLDDKEANRFLPFQVATKQAEHIGAKLDGAEVITSFLGISSADVHNRDPRDLPLVVSGAESLGNGILACKDNVVFYQLPPYTLTQADGQIPSFVVEPIRAGSVSDGTQDAVDGKHSALITLGVTAGAQFGQKIDVRPTVGKTYTFAVSVKGVGGPVKVHLEIERAGRPWDRAVKGDDVQVPADRWTEVHVSFKCDKPFSEGWQAYIASSQDGGRFRADAFRLYEGAYQPVGAAGAAGAAGAKNLFINPGFENGQKPWFFTYHEKQNVRRTYRRSCYVLNRLLANMGVRAKTPLLERFSKPVGGQEARPSVVTNGDFQGDQKLPTGWQLSSDSPGAAALRETVDGKPALRLTLAPGGKSKPSIMLAQNDVPVKEGQWYRLSLRARAEGMAGKPVTLALQSTVTWNSFIGYLAFKPSGEWKTYQFTVQASGTAENKTRFQIYHDHIGTLWLAEVAMTPVAPPTSDGRWSEGYYCDQPEEWDDPYRFFRW